MKIISHLALSAVLILSLLTGCAVKDPKNPRFVVAKGKGVSVTRGDLTKAEESILSQRGINLDQLPPDHLVRIERQVAEQLALQELLLKNASGVPEKEVQSELDSKFKMAEQRFGGTEGFKAQLAKDNVTESKLRKDLSKQIRIELFLKGLVANTPSPSAQEVEKYYNDNKRLFEHPAAVRASHILVAVPPQASAAEKAARKKVAEAAYARVKKGEDFAKVASEVSEDPGSAKNGGDLGYFSTHQMVPQFEKVAFGTRLNQVSPVFETTFGYHFLKVTGNKPAGTIPFDEAKTKIHDFLKNRARGQKVQEYIKDLLAKAEITYTLPTPPPSSSKATLPQSLGSQPNG